MNYAYNTQAPKKPTNVSINSDLLAKAKALKIKRDIAKAQAAASAEVAESPEA